MPLRSRSAIVSLKPVLLVAISILVSLASVMWAPQVMSKEESAMGVPKAFTLPLAFVSEEYSELYASLSPAERNLYKHIQKNYGDSQSNAIEKKGCGEQNVCRYEYGGKNYTLDCSATCVPLQDLSQDSLAEYNSIVSSISIDSEMAYSLATFCHNHLNSNLMGGDYVYTRKSPNQFAPMEVEISLRGTCQTFMAEFESQVRPLSSEQVHYDEIRERI